MPVTRHSSFPRFHLAISISVTTGTPLLEHQLLSPFVSKLISLSRVVISIARCLRDTCSTFVVPCEKASNLNKENLTLTNLKYAFHSNTTEEKKEIRIIRLWFLRFRLYEVLPVKVCVLSKIASKKKFVGIYGKHVVVGGNLT